MARLISVCKKETSFSRRQMPLEESDIKMVVQFEKCRACEGQVKQKDLDKFLAKCKVLTNDELAVALLATSKDILQHLAQALTCVGCRRSVEQLFQELVTSGFPTLEPLIITPHSELSIKADVVDPRSLFCLFYIHGPRHSSVLETQAKGKNKKRCNLHSLDTHKVKTPSCWSEVWDLMSQDIQHQVLTISCVKFEDTLSSYLTKHRFCTECRAKVMLAYNILIGEADAAAEKGYCVRLFEKLQTCNKDGHRHIHVQQDDSYIEMLINMAEPELTNMNRRDRHAKTLDIAQEEVLTCLGIHIYDRLHKIHQKLRQEEQTWRLLFSLGVDTLRKNFECAVERKQGVSNLERMCEELEEEARIKEQRQELKRQKKKRKKAAKSERENMAQKNKSVDEDRCECSSVALPPKPLGLSHCDNHSHCPPSPNNINNNAVCTHPFPHHHHHHHHLIDVSGHSCADARSGRNSPTPASLGSAGGCRSADCGYSSEPDNCDNCSTPSSNDGSEVCSDGVCMHDGEDCILAGDLNWIECQSFGGSPERKIGPGTHACGASTLEDLLAMSSVTCDAEGAEGGEEEDEDEGGISAEDIALFQANRSNVQRQRLELRETLKQRFQNMRQQREASPCPCPALQCQAAAARAK